MVEKAMTSSTILYTTEVQNNTQWFLNNTTIPTHYYTDNDSIQNNVETLLSQYGLWEERSTMLWRVAGPLILMVGTFGNIMTMLVLRKMMSEACSFQPLFMVLAVADLLLLYVVILPRWVGIVLHHQVVSLNRVSCKLLLWLEFSLQTLSAWLLATMTAQRALSIIWQCHRRRLKPRKQALITIAVLFTISFAFNCTTLLDMDKEHTLSLCGWMKDESARNTFDLVELVVNSVLPSTIMIVCNGLLIRTVIKSSRKTHHLKKLEPGHVDHHDAQASRVTLTLIVVSIVFILLTLPMNAINIVKNMNPDLRANGPVVFIHHFTVLLWITNSSVNFFLYILTGSRFRSEGMKMLKATTASCTKRKRRPGGSSETQHFHQQTTDF